MKYSISKKDKLRDRLDRRLSVKTSESIGGWAEERLPYYLLYHLWDQLNYRSHHQLINLLMNKLKRYEV
jgi:hypothetical protein